MLNIIHCSLTIDSFRSYLIQHELQYELKKQGRVWNEWVDGIMRAFGMKIGKGGEVDRSLIGKIELLLQ